VSFLPVVYLEKALPTSAFPAKIVAASVLPDAAHKPAAPDRGQELEKCYTKADRVTRFLEEEAHVQKFF